MIAYPETEQFRTIIADLRRNANFKEEDRGKPLPTMKFIGTVKLHGTNSAIAFQKDNGFWCQSRNNVITPMKDNAGFATMMSPVAEKFFFEKVLPHSSTIRQAYDEGKPVIIYGEWCGGNIQKNVAITGLNRMFVIFKVKIVDKKTVTNAEGGEEDVKVGSWVHPNEWKEINWHEKWIYNVYDFPTYEIDIDFNFPELAQNKLVEITEAVERQCPVGLYFKSDGVGEGVVWTEWEKTCGGIRFKVKGEKHSVSKVKTLAPVDTEKIASVKEFVEYACTDNRMSQGLDYLREQHLSIEMKNFGTFLKWLIGDIVKEERDTIADSNIDIKDISRYIQGHAKAWYEMHLSS